MNPTLMSGVIATAAFIGAIMLLHALHAAYESYRARFTHNARTRLEEAFVFIDPNKLFMLTLLGVVVIPPLTWFLSRNLLMAGTVMSQIPMLAVFLIAQRWFIRSIAFTGLK